MYNKEIEKTQLFLIHYAGGNCNSFYYLKSYFPELDVVCIELPGRGLRMRERLVTEYEIATVDIYNQIKNRIKSQKFIIYGHSMGSYLALRSTFLLEKSGRFPCSLIVSGNPGPGIPRNAEDKTRYLMSKHELKEELNSMGGASKEFLNNEELFDFFEPIIRADFEIIEKNELTNEPVVRAPIFAIMGNEEKYYEKISNWGNFTMGKFKYEILPGGHFFMLQEPEKLVTIIRNSYVNNFHLLRSEINLCEHS